MKNNQKNEKIQKNYEKSEKKLYLITRMLETYSEKHKRIMKI